MIERYFICPCCRAETKLSRVICGMGNMKYCPVCCEPLSMADLCYRDAGCAIGAPASLEGKKTLTRGVLNG